MSKWWEMMKIHQAKTKFKTEWKGSYPVKRILSDPFSCLCLPYTWFYFFPMPLINLQVSPQISRFFLPWSPGSLVFWGWAGLRGLPEGLFLVKLTLSEHPILYYVNKWVTLFEDFLPIFTAKRTCIQGTPTKVTWVSTNYRFHCRWGW